VTATPISLPAWRAGPLTESTSSSPHASLAGYRAAWVLQALHNIGWSTKRQSGRHRRPSRPGWPDYVFAFHDAEEIGPVICR